MYFTYTDFSYTGDEQSAIRRFSAIAEVWKNKGERLAPGIMRKTFHSSHAKRLIKTLGAPIETPDMW